MNKQFTFHEIEDFKLLFYNFKSKKPKLTYIKTIITNYTSKPKKCFEKSKQAAFNEKDFFIKC